MLCRLIIISIALLVTYRILMPKLHPQ